LTRETPRTASLLPRSVDPTRVLELDGTPVGDPRCDDPLSA